MNMHKIAVNGGTEYIVVKEVAAGKYEIVDDSLTAKDGDSRHDQTNLGFSDWEDDVIDLDNGQSDESQCFGISSMLQWNDVILRPETIEAKSVDLIEEAFKRVEVIAYCPGEV